MKLCLMTYALKKKSRVKKDYYVKTQRKVMSDFPGKIAEISPCETFLLVADKKKFFHFFGKFKNIVFATKK